MTDMYYRQWRGVMAEVGGEEGAAALSKFWAVEKMLS